MSLEGLYLEGLIFEILRYIKAIGAQGIVLKIRCIVVKKSRCIVGRNQNFFFASRSLSRQQQGVNLKKGLTPPESTFKERIITFCSLFNT